MKSYDQHCEFVVCSCEFYQFVMVDETIILAYDASFEQNESDWKVKTHIGIDDIYYIGYLMEV